MPRKRDSKCGGCGILLQGFERRCEACLDPKTLKALSKVYRQMNEQDERIVKTKKLFRCRFKDCVRYALTEGRCEKHPREKETSK